VLSNSVANIQKDMEIPHKSQHCWHFYF